MPVFRVSDYFLSYYSAPTCSTLLGTNNLVKICDLGYSKHEDLNSAPDSTVGSLYYMGESLKPASNLPEI